MKKEVYDYFVNFNNLGLPSEKDFLCPESKDFSKIGVSPYQSFYSIAGNKCHVKNWRTCESIMAIATSKLYNKIGILTPPVFPIESKESQAHYTFAQDVRTIPDLKPELRNTLGKYRQIANDIGNSTIIENPWDIVTDEQIKSKFLEFMTEECYDALTNLYLVNDLTTQYDSHSCNDFLYKIGNSKKFNGIVAIDLEASCTASIASLQQTSFKDFLQIPFSYCTIVDHIDRTKTIPERIKLLKELISSGKLKTSQIEILKNTLSENFPKSIKQLYGLDTENKSKIKAIYEMYARLWDYHHKQLDKELGL